MQLAIAGHQFEHSASYAEFCDVCVQVDRFDDAVAEQPATVVLLRPVNHIAKSRSEVAVIALIVSGYSPRAPPFV